MQNYASNFACLDPFLNNLFKIFTKSALIRVGDGADRRRRRFLRLPSHKIVL